MDSPKLISVLFIATFLLLLPVSTLSATVDSCPGNCYCFVVSRNFAPPTALLSNYIQTNDWLDGSKAIACWGRTEVPSPLAPDIRYLLLVGSQKPKRDRQAASFSLHTRMHRGRLAYGPGALFNIGSLRRTRRRNIRTIAPDAFSGLREIIQIDLHGNKIMGLSASTFQGITTLQGLNLNENRLKTLRPTLLQDLTALKEFHVSENFLRSMPDELFLYNQLLERLDMSDNMLTIIPYDTFQAQGNLKYLNLSHNRLTEKNEIMFSGLAKLEELYLQGNKLSRVGTKLFVSNSQLQKLDLSHNRIKYIKPRAFKNLHQLESLDLTGNALTSLDSSTFQGATSLSVLDLSYNAIHRVKTGAFTGLTNLTKLYMEANSLTNITKNTFDNVPSLMYLALANNEILDILPKAMSHLDKVEFLDLSGNRLQHLRMLTFEGMDNLMELNVANNEIFIVEPEAFKTTTLSFMSKLTWLNLQGNKLVELQSDVFRGAPSLRVLTVSKNRISRVVNQAFSGFNRLQRLVMSDNELEVVPKGAFRLLRTLEGLDISNNSLREIHFDGFKGLGELNDLNLADNALINDNMPWLKPLRSVRTLNLNGNHYTKMTSKNFEIASDLRYLHLSRNNLTKVSIAEDSRLYLYNLTLSKNFLTHLDEFHTRILPGSALDLSNNPWHCDCQLVTFFSDMWRNQGIRFDKERNTRCHTPDELRGAEIVTLGSSDVTCVGDDLVNVTADWGTTTQPTVTQGPAPPTPMTLDGSKRWSWVALIWDTTADMPVCNGALVSTGFVLTTNKCLQRISNIDRYMKLVSRCSKPLEDPDCLDEVWSAPYNLEIKISHGRRTMSEFQMVAMTYQVLRMHKVPNNSTTGDLFSVLLQVSPDIDIEGPAAVIDIVQENQLNAVVHDGKRVLAAGWWINPAYAPRVVGRQKRRHYRIDSVQCDSNAPIELLCAYLEQDMGKFTSWELMGTPVTVRVRNVWKLIGILMENEGRVGYIKDIRQERDSIYQIISQNTISEQVTHPY